MENICAETTARKVKCQILLWKFHLTFVLVCINFRAPDPVTDTVFSQTQRRLVAYPPEVNMEACRYIKFHPPDCPVTRSDPLKL
jgi:hypothetical protein